MRGDKARKKKPKRSHLGRSALPNLRSRNGHLHRASFQSPDLGDFELTSITFNSPPSFPKSLLVAGETWAIYYSPNLLATRSLYGVTLFDRRTIIVDSTATKQQMREVLLHEVLHACFDMNDIIKVVENPTEELIVRALAPVLIRVLRDNGRFW